MIFAVDPDTGELTCVGHEPTQGEYPWNFALDPTGTLLLVANRNTDNITTFHVDQQTGKLMPTGHVTGVPRPVCVKMLPISS